MIFGYMMILNQILFICGGSYFFSSVLTVAKSRRIIVCAKTQVGFWAYAARVGSCGSTGF
jgi:glutamine amidotransferase-like uncharacterized protein